MPADPIQDDPCPETILSAARLWLGTPWRHQGRGPGGVDCVGLIVRVARDLGLSDYDLTGYDRRARGVGFLEHFEANLVSVPIADAQPADILVFADQAYPCHCGFLSHWRGAAHVIHAHALRRKVIEEPYAGEWRQKVKRAYRFPHLADRPEAL